MNISHLILQRNKNFGVRVYNQTILIYNTYYQEVKQ